ncbi:alpha-galactosidase [Jiangella aurantiaca]|uniref:alpha-galactosidase n=1 Tax=Jiangella aurantiaca TaxID=2530373 RepID=UPI00193D87AE|nr:alpha-galactosidase [Jiangella aurantiaca]
MSTTLPDEDTRGSRDDGAWPERVQLSAKGVALILALPADSLPIVIHWGADPGQLGDGGLASVERASLAPLATNGVDSRVSVSIVPEGARGWTGTPGVVGHRDDGSGWSPRFQVTSVTWDSRPGRGGYVEVAGSDPIAGLALRVYIELAPAGLVRTRAELTNVGPGRYTLDAVQLALPVPTRAAEVIDMAGRWAKERVPQRRPFTVGTHAREGRHGRTGADAPTLLLAVEKGIDFDRGDAWGIHVAFSGNHRHSAERSFSGERLLFGGELLLPGEIVLDEGGTYRTPWLFGSYGHGLDEVAARFHRHLRARPHHPRGPRPVVMNLWEAVYFDHDLARIIPLVELAAHAGVERFVLDDGWFGSRRDDRSGLGDWVVADSVWGEGRFDELVAAVKSRGMEFGLWFEPEMVNVDSDLARTHPEWVLQVPGRLPVEARHQQVLDLTYPEAFAYIRDSIVSLVRRHGIDYIKWDHNRDLVDAGSTLSGRANVHEQTLAAYRLLDEIRSACPGLEIESCSSGGGRVDLEIVEHTDRVWASDCIDPHERQQIQRWTLQLLPWELIGSHIGAERAHTTQRKSDLGFRAATAIFGSLGIEWDLSEATDEELAQVTDWVSFYKSVRHLIHSGTSIRRSLEGGDLWLTGAVSPDRERALYQVVLRRRHVTWPVGAVRLPGLDAHRSYIVRAAGPGSEAPFDPRVHPEWWGKGVELSGAALGEIGIQIPALDPDHAVTLSVEAT